VRGHRCPRRCCGRCRRCPPPGLDGRLRIYTRIFTSVNLHAYISSICIVWNVVHCRHMSRSRGGRCRRCAPPRQGPIYYMYTSMYAENMMITRPRAVASRAVPRRVYTYMYVNLAMYEYNFSHADTRHVLPRQVDCTNRHPACAQEVEMPKEGLFSRHANTAYVSPTPCIGHHSMQCNTMSARAGHHRRKRIAFF